MLSKITGGETDFIFTGKLLNLHKVKYYRCRDTGFIQTEQPYWLEQAYSSVITKLDVGLVQRNQLYSDIVSKHIASNFNVEGEFLDYAGGYGLFTRMMRDKGLNFFHTDAYCQNIFAEYFDLKDSGKTIGFEVTTAFEVFEHLENPLEDVKRILEFSDNLFFTTELQPKTGLSSINDWWYFAPETGQHISFYTEEALVAMANHLRFNYYTDGVSLHLFTKKSFSSNPLRRKKDPFLVRKLRKYINKYDTKNPLPESLLQADWRHIKRMLV